MQIRLRSVTYAMKAKEILENAGIGAGVVKDLMVSGSGCVYAVTFDDRYKSEAVKLLQTRGVMLHKSNDWTDFS